VNYPGQPGRWQRIDYPISQQTLTDIKEAHVFFTEMLAHANETGDEWRAWVLQQERQRLATIHARIKEQL
jgi:hypothetical protein